MVDSGWCKKESDAGREGGRHLVKLGLDRAYQYINTRGRGRFKKAGWEPH